MQRTIELDEGQIRDLERLASANRRTVDDLIRFAVSDHLPRRQHNQDACQQRFDAVEASFREGVPADMTPEEIEAEITAARTEHRAEHATQRASNGLTVSSGCDRSEAR
jgi:predicted transcriptional regulator